MLQSIRCAQSSTFPRFYTRASGTQLQRRFCSFEQKFLKTQANATENQINDFKNLIELHPVLKKSNPKSLIPKISLLKMMQTPQEQLSQAKITRVVNSLGFEVRRTELLNYIELQLIDGGSQHLEEADFFAHLSKEVQQAKTNKKLKEIYLELKKTPYFEQFDRGYMPAKSIFDLLILKEMHPNTYENVKFHCLECFNFLSAESKYMERNRQIFKKAKHCFDNLLLDIRKNPETIFNKIPEIGFHELEIMLANAQNQVDLRKTFYTNHWKGKFELKSWGDICTNLNYRFKLYSNRSCSLHILWNILKKPEKMGLKLPIDKEFLRAFVKAKKIYIDYVITDDDERHTAYRYYTSLYAEMPPKLKQIREVTIQEIKASLKDGRYEEYKINELDFVIDFAKRHTARAPKKTS